MRYESEPIYKYKNRTPYCEHNKFRLEGNYLVCENLLCRKEWKLIEEHKPTQPFKEKHKNGATKNRN